MGRGIHTHFGTHLTSFIQHVWSCECSVTTFLKTDGFVGTKVYVFISYEENHLAYATEVLGTYLCPTNIGSLKCQDKVYFNDLKCCRIMLLKY